MTLDVASNADGPPQWRLDSRALELAAEARQIARDARDQCRGEYESLRQELLSHRKDTERRFDAQDAERKVMHSENGIKFDRLFRALYIAIGLGMAVSALLSHSTLAGLATFLGK